jgi:hypothetical protein
MVSRSNKGIYQVVHDEEYINAAIESMTYIDFHKRMGHISPEVAKKLAVDGMATGV